MINNNNNNNEQTHNQLKGWNSQVHGEFPRHPDAEGGGEYYYYCCLNMRHQPNARAARPSETQRVLGLWQRAVHGGQPAGGTAPDGRDGPTRLSAVGLAPRA